MYRQQNVFNSFSVVRVVRKVSFLLCLLRLWLLSQHNVKGKVCCLRVHLELCLLQKSSGSLHMSSGVIFSKLFYPKTPTRSYETCLYTGSSNSLSIIWKLKYFSVVRGPYSLLIFFCFMNFQLTLIILHFCILYRHINVPVCSFSYIRINKR